ncbi:MAG: D-3-phosphoglycerate dehydrogenase, partial [Bacteroidota bacterium]
LSQETDYFVDTHFIEHCVKPFVLINTARGRHVELSALLAGLENGKIEGACLDVLELEKTSFESIQGEGSAVFQRLIQRDDVVLSPHIAGWTHESYLKLSSFLAQKILNAFK